MLGKHSSKNIVSVEGIGQSHNSPLNTPNSINIKQNGNNNKAMPADPWTGWLERNSGESAQQTYGAHPIGSNGLGR